MATTPPSKKILVTVASRFGSTYEIGSAIVQALAPVAELKNLQEVTDLSPYRAVIIGSAIQYDTWLPEAKDFMERHLEALQKMPVALFFACLTLARTEPKAKAQAQEYANALAGTYADLQPVSIGQFAGVLNYSKFPFLARPIARVIFAFLGVASGDHRDWFTIRTWAKHLTLLFPSS